MAKRIVGHVGSSEHKYTLLIKDEEEITNLLRILQSTDNVPIATRTWAERLALGIMESGFHIHQYNPTFCGICGARKP